MALSYFFQSVYITVSFLIDFTDLSPILGPLVPLFWISGDVSLRFQGQSGICFICIADTNIIYIP